MYITRMITARPPVTQSPSSSPSELNLWFGVSLVELHQISNVISTAKEYRAPLMYVLGNKVENTLCPRGGETSCLITRPLEHGGTSRCSPRHSPVPSRMPSGTPRTACEVYQTCSSCRSDNQRCPHKVAFGARLRPWNRYTERNTGSRFLGT